MVSVVFGTSSIVIDRCPRCDGIWFDRYEFDAIIEYLKCELRSMSSTEIADRALTEVKQVWSGGPAGRLEELLDATAVVSALINTSIFEHPFVAKLCLSTPRL
jgi:hypothetical protein